MKNLEQDKEMIFKCALSFAVIFLKSRSSNDFLLKGVTVGGVNPILMIKIRFDKYKLLNYIKPHFAGVVELADTSDLGSDAIKTCVGVQVSPFA